MFCLPARGAREEVERKRRERGDEACRLVFPSWLEPATYFTSSDGQQALWLGLHFQVTHRLLSDLSWLEDEFLSKL